MVHAILSASTGLWLPCWAFWTEQMHHNFWVLNVSPFLRLFPNSRIAVLITFLCLAPSIAICSMYISQCRISWSSKNDFFSDYYRKQILKQIILQICHWYSSQVLRCWGKNFAWLGNLLSTLWLTKSKLQKHVKQNSSFATDVTLGQTFTWLHKWKLYLAGT